MPSAQLSNDTNPKVHAEKRGSQRDVAAQEFKTQEIAVWKCRFHGEYLVVEWKYEGVTKLHYWRKKYVKVWDTGISFIEQAFRNERFVQ